MGKGGRGVIEKTFLGGVFKRPREYVLYLTVSAYLTVSGFSVHPVNNRWPWVGATGGGAKKFLGGGDKIFGPGEGVRGEYKGKIFLFLPF